MLSLALYYKDENKRPHFLIDVMVSRDKQFPPNMIILKVEISLELLLKHRNM